jgi:hypothetical protein
MSLLDDFKTQGAAFRLTEEMLFAEVYREMEAGIKRDGLWAMALAESKFDESTAKSLYIKYRVQSLKDEIRIADLGKTDNPAPKPKELPPTPIPRHNKKIDKDLTCNSCGYFGKMTWTRDTTISDNILIFVLGWMFGGFLAVGILQIVSDTNIAVILSLVIFGLSFVVVYFWVSKFIVACPKCKNKGRVFSDIK